MKVTEGCVGVKTQINSPVNGIQFRAHDDDVWVDVVEGQPFLANVGGFQIRLNNNEYSVTEWQIEGVTISKSSTLYLKMGEAYEGKVITPVLKKRQVPADFVSSPAGYQPLLQPAEIAAFKDLLALVPKLKTFLG
jgi:hypothetical protein